MLEITLMSNFNKFSGGKPQTLNWRWAQPLPRPRSFDFCHARNLVYLPAHQFNRIQLKLLLKKCRNMIYADDSAKSAELEADQERSNDESKTDASEKVQLAFNA